MDIVRELSFTEVFPLLMFPAMFVGVLSGFPVAFVLAAVGLLFGLVGHFWLDAFVLSDFGFVSAKIFGVMSNVTLISVPLFIFMGMVLERSGIAEDLLQASEQMLRKTQGGVLYGLVLVGTLLAASTGIVGATVITMSLLSLPPLLERKYDSALAAGTICASGTLGQIIPPSIVLILLADMMNLAVADLFAGAIVPGLLLVLSYLAYIKIRISLNPKLAPSWDENQQRESLHISLKSIASAMLPPLCLMVVVLGSILFGIASPTESAGCGAFGAIVIAVMRRRFSKEKLREALRATTSLTSMVFTLLIGAQVFSVVFRGMYGDDVLVETLATWQDKPSMMLWMVMLFFFILGCFLDFLEICFIFVPILTPILVLHGGYSPLWLAILIAINLQTSFLTPPFGFSLFYLRGVAPPEVSTADIYKGAIPFVVMQILVLITVYLFPGLILWFPNAIWGK
ncbi:MAG: TRAP transporter large permease subunit [Bdellovibrionales bacterium]|nr:TRAP transporter large permease subunit [Bdellovibrionales bacterium]